jgi:hypothetical protein
LTIGSTIAIVTIEAKFSPLAFLVFLTKFTIEINGSRGLGSWGKRTVSLPSVQHTMKLSFRYPGSDVGKASVPLSLIDGVSPVYQYKEPWLVFLKGRVKQLS